MATDTAKLVEQLGKMTVLELVELKNALEETWGVTAAAPVAVAAAGAPAAAGDGAPAAEEQTSFDVVLTAAGEAALTLSGGFSPLRAGFCREERLGLHGRLHPLRSPRMKLKILLVAVFVAGIVVSFAIAAPPPGKGKDKGKGKGRNAGAASTSSTTSTGGTTTSASGKKTLICHRTHSKKKPYHLIWVSNKAVAAHLRHGDVLPTDGQCPSSVTTSTTTSSTTTSQSTTTTE